MSGEWKPTGRIVDYRLWPEVQQAIAEEEQLQLDRAIGARPAPRFLEPGPLKQLVTKWAHNLWPDQPDGVEWVLSEDGEFWYREKDLATSA
jgi:hypothetical protein